MKSTVRVFLACTVWYFCFSPNLSAGTIGKDLRKKMQQLNPGDEVAVIITLADQVDVRSFRKKNRKQRRADINRALRDKANRSQNLLRTFLKQNNARKLKSFWIFNGITATVSVEAVSELAARPDILNITLDKALSLPVPVPAAAGTPEWNIDAINAPSLWALGHTGKGVILASMDTGVDSNHPDLATRWRGGVNSWFDPHGVYSSPHDSDGHGTKVMGVMIGGDAGGSSIGVAPGATWIAVKLFDDSGLTQYSDIHAGFQWLLDPDKDPMTDDAPDVVNNSWGFETEVNNCLAEFQLDVQALKAAGIAVVFSAGNSGPGTSTSISPANYPESFAVGGIDNTLTVALSSSRGPSACDATVFPEIVAPGVNIWTSDLTLGGVNPDPYASATGTSFAAPHLSGAMALLISASPQLTIADLETSLGQNVTDLGAPGADNDYGNGLLDVDAAYNSFPTHPLAATLGGEGSGSVSTYPGGINCPGDCSGEYIAGTVVTLTAVPGQSSRFKGWSGDCTGNALTCQVTMDQARNVSAQFYPFPWHLFFSIPAMTHNQ